MIKMNEEVYLQNIVFKKTYDDKGCVMGEIVFKNAMTYEEFENILDERYFVLTDKQLQNNWNELKKWLEEEIKEYQKDKYSGDYGLVLGFIRVVQQKMQELEGNNE